MTTQMGQLQYTRNVMKLFNTLTNKKEEFKPLKEGEVSIYV